GDTLRWKSPAHLQPGTRCFKTSRIILLPGNFRLPIASTGRTKAAERNEIAEWKKNKRYRQWRNSPRREGRPKYCSGSAALAHSMTVASQSRVHLSKYFSR